MAERAGLSPLTTLDLLRVQIERLIAERDTVRGENARLDAELKRLVAELNQPQSEDLHPARARSAPRVPDSERLLLRVSEVATALGVGRSTVYQFMNEAGFPVIRLGGARRIPRARLIEWIERKSGALSS